MWKSLILVSLNAFAIQLRAEPEINEKEFQVVANLVDAITEVRYESIEFEHSDKDGLKAKALAQAIDKAGEKKKLCEEKLGVKLTPKAFKDAGIASPPPPPGYYGKTLSYDLQPSSITQLPGSRVADAEAPAEDMPTSFGELVYKAQVTVEYALENK